MSMSLNKEKKLLNVMIPNSEAEVDAQMNGIKDRGVTGYYTNDNEILKNEIKKFLIENYNYYIDKKITIEFIEKLRDEVYRYSFGKKIFKNEMSNLDETLQYFSKFETNYIHIPKLYFGGQNERYLKFVNDDPVVKQFRSILYGEITGFIIQQKDNNFIIYPYLLDNWQQIIDRKERELSMKNYWIIPINRSIYNYEDSIKNLNYIDILQDAKFKNEDICYIYINSNGNKIKYKAIAQIDVDSSKVDKNKELWKENFQFDQNKKYTRLKIIKSIFDDDKSLSLENIQKLGVSTIQNILNINENIALQEYIENVFSLYYNKSDFLNEVFISSEDYDTLKELLYLKKNIILEGAPGVGKTFMAKRLAYSIIGKKNNEQLLSIQFHQSYSYEDFIEGIRPDEDGKFHLVNGVFKDFVDKANKNRSKKYFCIIDEINRGNLSKIFGELMKLIECDKRDNENVVLPYSKQIFTVPDNLYIIGTMNTADRSLAMVDYALRRRFAFYFVEPAFNRQEFRKYLINNNKLKINDVDTICNKFNSLNERIEQDLGKGFKIGHSYFVDRIDANSFEKSYSLIIKYEIKPLIEEYWYDEEDKVNEYLSIL